MNEQFVPKEEAGLLPEVASVRQKLDLGRERLPLPTTETLPTFLRDIGERIREISGQWNPVELYTADPESLAHERELFLAKHAAGEQYEPHFSYTVAEQMRVTESRAKLEELTRDLQALPISQTDRAARLARVIVHAKLEDDLATCDLVDGIQQKNEALIGRALRAKYQGTDPELIAKASTEYVQHTQDIPEATVESSTPLLSTDEQTWLQQRQFSALEIQAVFEWGLAKLGHPQRSVQTDNFGFRVVVDERATSVDVRDKSTQGPTIFIPAGRSVDGKDLLELLVHEVGAHARQSLNGMALFHVGGGAFKIDDETAYEGLAMRNEAAFHRKFYGKLEDPMVWVYVLAVRVGEEGGSFSDVFANQLDMRLHMALKIHPDQPLPAVSWIDPAVYNKAREAAWRTSYRVMRGHVDMKNPHSFAMTKDLAYYRGGVLDDQLLSLGLGHLNEAAVFKQGGLRALAEFVLEPEDLPIKNIDLAELYWNEVLKPEYDASRVSGNSESSSQ